MSLSFEKKWKVSPSALSGVLIIESNVFSDERGWFMESFNARDFAKATGLSVEFVQDNHSFSRQWTLRGLHYQLTYTQGKLIRVTSGAVFDVVVDLRKDSTTYSQWSGAVLRSENHQQLWIPPGFAHGFLALSETAQVLYKTTDYYDPQSEVSLAWNDPTLSIDWPIPAGIAVSINTKDANSVSWDKAPKF